MCEHGSLRRNLTSVAGRKALSAGHPGDHISSCRTLGQPFSHVVFRGYAPVVHGLRRSVLPVSWPEIGSIEMTNTPVRRRLCEGHTPSHGRHSAPRRSAKRNPDGGRCTEFAQPHILTPTMRTVRQSRTLPCGAGRPASVAGVSRQPGGFVPDYDVLKPTRQHQLAGE